ncbi:MAG: arginine--tRNA ligase [Candidatus Marinimicrobia bacterium]|nr:arginine--tRNA ligase [Candidatus Neomarinimicrobiota bacterium]
MDFKQYINEIISNALTELDIQSNVVVEKSSNPNFGDYSTNIALSLAKQLKNNPLEIAKNIGSLLKYDNEIISEHSVSKPGFLNFHISDNYYQKTISKIISASESYGMTTIGKNKTANVEFVSANPTGPLTVGHGRQAVLGDTIANILEWHNYKVTREYYYNDAGRQMRILGESVAARYFNLIGKEYKFPEDGYKGEYIISIANEIKNKHGKDLETNSMVFRKEAEKAIFNDIKKTLNSIGINHDVFSNEQTYYDNGSIDTLVEELTNKNLIYKSDGAVWFKATDLGLEKDRVYYKSSGEATYRLPDTAYHQHKLDRSFDLIVDIFGADHADAYPDVLAALNALDVNTDTIKVLIHQFVTLLKSGEKVKMSTRKANFVTLDELINEVGGDVVRYFFIMRSMNSHLNFDLDLATDQSEKNPVFYLQYAHARICNILRYAEKSGYVLKDNFDKKLLDNSSEIDLIKSLHQFPEMMLNVLESLEPQTIATYLQSLAGKYHKFYTDCRVVSEDISLTNSRLNLICAVKLVLANGLKILGISAPERM